MNFRFIIMTLKTNILNIFPQFLRGTETPKIPPSRSHAPNNPGRKEILSNGVLPTEIIIIPIWYCEKFWELNVATEGDLKEFYIKTTNVLKVVSKKRWSENVESVEEVKRWRWRKRRDRHLVTKKNHTQFYWWCYKFFVSSQKHEVAKLFLVRF